MTMTNDDIELILSILEDTTDRFWVVAEKGSNFYVIGGNPWELQDALSGHIHPFSWRDQFNKPTWDEY